MNDTQPLSQQQQETASRLDTLREARQSYSVKWQDFIARANNNPTAFHCFFEGQDAKYYGSRIRALPEAPTFIEYRCGGKDAVCRLIHLITSSDEYKDMAVAFFLDRDFDDESRYAQHSNVYVTEGYSIENYYISDEAIERIITGEFGLDPLSDVLEIQAVTSMLLSALSDFVDKSREINAWLAAIRDTELMTPARRRLNLDSHNIFDYIHPSLAGNITLYGLAELPKRFEVEAPDSVSLSKRQIDFAVVDGRLTFRGKWLLEGVRKYLEELKMDRRKTPPSIFTKRGNATLQLSKGNMISQLSHYADTPEPLKAFLLKFCKAEA
jgi:hypothetical protein